MKIGLGTGLSNKRRARSGAPLPPLTANLLAFYDANYGTTLSGSPAVNYGKIDGWAPKKGTAGSLLQGTDANRMRLRNAGATPVVYQWQADSSRTMAESTLVINKRDCSAFVLIELGQLIVNGIAENQTILSLPGGVGELYLNKASASHFKVAWKDGTGSYVSSLVPASSLNLIGLTLSAGAVVVHCNGESETLAAVALASGTVTGFRINFGTLAYGDAWGYHCIAIYDHALTGGELDLVEAWGQARKAIYPSDTTITQHLFTTGASRSVGYHPEGNIDHGRRLSLDAPKRPFWKLGFGGLNTSSLLTRAKAELTTQEEGSSFKPGDGFHRPTINQVVVIEVPVADVTSGTAEATIISNLTALRQAIKLSGYQCVMNALAPVSSWDAGQLTKMTNINSAMAALDTRRYGDFVVLPTELSNASDLTYFYSDGIHYTKAGYDVLYSLLKPYVDNYYTRTVTTNKGHWSLNGTFEDDSGCQRDLQAINTPTFETGLNGHQCVRCYTTGNHAVKYHSAARCWDSLPLTMVAWFKVPSLGSSEIILCKQSDSGGSKNWALYKKWNNKIVASVSDVSVGELETSFMVTADTWYGVAMILDAANGLRLYTTDAGTSTTVNPSTFALRGTSGWTSTPVVPFAASGRGALRIGCSSDTGCSNIFVQDVESYFEARTLSQLQALVP